MKLSRLLLLSAFVAQPFVMSGCMERNRAADKDVEALSNRMKLIEKDANNVNPKKVSEPK